MALKKNGKAKVVVAGGVDEYIGKYPIEVQARLNEIRTAIQEAAPGYNETVSYFEIPGYFFDGFDYNGMFAWFSYKKSVVRLHVRPPVIDEHTNALKDYAATKAIVSFPADKAIPKLLVKELVKASIKVMKKDVA